MGISVQCDNNVAVVWINLDRIQVFDLVWHESAGHGQFIRRSDQLLALSVGQMWNAVRSTGGGAAGHNGGAGHHQK